MVAEPLYLARYIEKAGSGTLDMIEQCTQTGLPAPDFEERAGQFVTTLWRDWLTAEVMDRLELNDRQLLCIKMLKVERQTTTMAYQNLVGCSRRTVARDLDELLNKGIIQRKGAGRSAYYVLTRNRAIIFLERSLASQDPNRAINVPNAPSHETLGSKLAEGRIPGTPYLFIGINHHDGIFF